MPGIVICIFVNQKNLWSMVIPLIESVLAMFMFIMSTMCIIMYFTISKKDCFIASMAKIPAIIHICLFILEFLNGLYFKYDTLAGFTQTTTNTSSSTTLLIESEKENQLWWRVYTKHYLVSAWKLIYISVEITFLCLFSHCPWTYCLDC